MIDSLFDVAAFGASADWAQDFIDTANRIGATPGDLAAQIDEASEAFGGKMVGIARGILGVTIAIRLMMVIVKELLDGDIVELVGEVFFTLLLGLFLLILLNGWTGGGEFSVPEYARELMGAVMSAAGGGGDNITSGIAGVFAPILESVLTVLGLIWEIVSLTLTTLQSSISEIGQVDSWGDLLPGAFLSQIGSSFGLFQSVLMNFVLGVIASIAVIIAFCVLVYHMLSGFITLSVVIAFGPLTLGAYPLVDTWAKKALSSIAGAIVQMAAAIFLMSILKTVLENAVGFMQGGVGP